MNSRKLFPFLVIAVLLIGFLLRAISFLRGDFFFFQDQSRDLLLVKDVVENGNLILIGSRTGFGGLFHGPVWIYSLIPSFLISGGNPFGTLIPVYVFYNLAIIISGLYAGWKLYNKWVGVLFAFFLAISQPLVASIYYMTDAHAMPLVFIAYLYSLIRYLRGGEKYFILAIFFAGIGFQFEPAFAILLLPFLLVSLLIVRRISPRTLLLSILAFTVSISNFLLFELRHRFLMTNAFFNLLTGKLGALPGYENYQRLDFRIADRLQSAVSSFFSPIYSKDPLSILLIILTIGLSLFIFKNKKQNYEKKEFIFLLLFPFLSYLFYVLYPYPLWDHYVLPVAVSSALLLSLSIWTIRKNLFGLLISIVFLVSAIVPVTNSLADAYTHISFQPISSDSSYRNQLAVAKWIIQDSNNKPSNYLVYNPSTFTYGMDYLFSWKTLIGSHQITPCQKNGLTYLIYYPHLKGDNNAYSFWKKNIIKTNTKPLLSKNFYGDIIVEKLNISGSEEQIDPNYCQNLLFR